MGEIGFGSLGSLLPELILLIGGLLILLLDVGQPGKEDESSGRAYLMVSVLFLIVALVGVILQAGMEPFIAVRHGCAGPVRVRS